MRATKLDFVESSSERFRSSYSRVCSGGQRPGQADVHGGVKIAAILLAPDRRHAVALEPQHLAVLRGRRHLQAQVLAVDARNLGFSSQQRPS